MESLASIYHSVKEKHNSEKAKLIKEFRSMILELQTPVSSSLSSNFFTESDVEMNSVRDWITRMLEYNLVDGKMNRATLLMSTYAQLSTSDKTKSPTVNVALLGWCIEMFQTYFLILDDIMDGSITRRGKACWYKNVSFIDNI